MRAQLDDIPAGDAGLQTKLQRLRALVDAARADVQFVNLARGLVREVPERDYAGERAAVSRFTRRMRYTRDPAGVELFTDPRILAQQLAAGVPAYGDCDDATGLACALLEALGHPTRFVVGGSGGRGNWSHIWAEVYDSKAGRWVPQDDTAKHKAAGWSPAPHFDRVLREPPTPAPTMDARLNLPTEVDLFSLPDEISGGLGKLKVRKLRKAFKTSLNPVKTLKAVGRNKLVRKALPIAAVVANVVPGVGQGVSVGLMAANAAVARQRASERARAARAAAEQQADADAAMQQQAAAEQQAAEAAAIMQQQAVQAERFDAPDLLPAVAPSYGDPRPWIDQATPDPWAQAPELQGLADWSSILNTAASYVPRVIETAGTGVFGSRVARAAGRLSPGLTAARALLPQTSAPTAAPATLATTSGGGGGGGPVTAWRDVPQRQATPQERGERQPQPRASLMKQHPFAFAAGTAALLFVVSRLVR